jgi:ArsR family transcriptional regulator, arsenate/arsenite/antimonite-responsive transcriptional repressor / arsenate reductase (thioredoxin)
LRRLIPSIKIASMSIAQDPSPAARAALHRALGEPSRLAIVEALFLSDRSPGELQVHLGLESNLLGFHLRVLEDAGVVERRPSDGDGRRRYVRLRPAALERIAAPRGTVTLSGPLFVCTHNAARSQFAAGLWQARTGEPAGSAGSEPAPVVHPLAVRVAEGYGLDLSGARPRGYDAVTDSPGVVVSVCDRAREGDVPFAGARLHWSVPDPSKGGRRAFEAAFADIAERVERLVRSVA